MDSAEHDGHEQGISRKSFLAGVSGVAVSGLLTGRGVSQSSLNSSQLGGAWQDVSNAFGLRDDLAYMNNGTLGPYPRAVTEAAQKAWEQLEQDPADTYFGPIAEEMEQVRARAAKFLGCDVSELAITRNMTEAMNTVAQGLGLKAGDRVLTTDHEHPGGLVGWEYLAGRDGIILERIRLDVPPSNPEQVIQQIEGAIRKDTRVISVSHVTHTTGLRILVQQMAELAHSKAACWWWTELKPPGPCRSTLSSSAVMLTPPVAISGCWPPKVAGFSTSGTKPASR